MWHIYIVRCRDGTLYTGITDDLAKRMVAHNAGKGAKYTRGRGPVTLVYSEQAESHSQALRREYRIKQLSRVEKESVIAGQLQV
ncbi:MAG: GIY-YIG nuclease family protein [Oscillospiraceae bacterium]|nr:GIY-YIG nuclease family protein [Oscillospiraceae bacterium]